MKEKLCQQASSDFQTLVEHEERINSLLGRVRNWEDLENLLKIRDIFSLKSEALRNLIDPDELKLRAELIQKLNLQSLSQFNEEGTAAAESELAHCYLINRRGEKISEDFIFIGEFREGFAVASNYLANGWIFLDCQGRQTFPKIFFDQPASFSEGLAKVRTSGTGFYFINKEGERVLPDKKELPFDYNMAGSFSQGLAPVKKGALEGWIYINKKGETVIKPEKQLIAAEPFSDGLAAVHVVEKTFFGGSSDYWTFLDLNGKETFRQRFDYVYSFVDGTAAVKINDDWFLLNTKGVKIAGPFAKINPYAEWPVVAQMPGRNRGFVYIDKTGKNITGQEFLSASSFKRGFGWARKDIDNLCLVNKRGKIAFCECQTI